MKFLKNKILLITGGTGSFGGAILKSLMNSNLKEIRIFSRDEKKQNDMRLLYKSKKLKFYIGDVRIFESINQAIKDVDYVYVLDQGSIIESGPYQALRDKKGSHLDQLIEKQTL